MRDESETLTLNKSKRRHELFKVAVILTNKIINSNTQIQKFGYKETILQLTMIQELTFYNRKGDESEKQEKVGNLG